MSCQHEGNDVDLRALRDGELDIGVPHGEQLLSLCEALVEGNADALATARNNVANAMGTDALIDAIAVAANFERMVRIADGTGVELGDSLAELSADIRADLQVERPPNWAG